MPLGCWVWCSEDVSQLSVVGSGVQVFCVPTDFFFSRVVLGVTPRKRPTGVSCQILSVIEKRVLKSPTDVVNLPV